MITQLFLPARIGTFRLYGERYISLSIEGSFFYAAVVYEGTRKIVIETLYQEYLQEEKDVAYIHDIIQRFIKTVSAFDAVRIIIPSSVIIFKELQLPFIDAEKISFVLPYEVEPLIPFSLDEATMSFMVNEVQGASSKVFVAAARNTDIQQHLALYSDVIVPDLITTDIIALHALFQRTALYTQQEGLHCFILLYEQTTKIVLCTTKGIHVVKNMHRGVEMILKNYINQCGGHYYDVLKKVMTGFSAASLDVVLEKEWNDLASEIQSVLQVLLVHYEISGQLPHMWIAGSYGSIPGLSSFLSSCLQVEVHLFEPEKIMIDKHLVYKGKSVGSWTPFAAVLGASMLLPAQESFSLASYLLKDKQESVLFRLWGIALGLTVTLFVIIAVHGFYYVSDLQTLHSQLERREVETLRPIIQASNQKIPPFLTLKRAQAMAEAALKTKEDAWQELQKNSITPLEVWYELTKLFDKNRFDVTVDMITMSRDEGPLKIDVSGIFKSKTGTDHFTHFADFEKRFSEAKLLALDGMNESLTDDGSVQFNTLFKIRDI